LSKLTSFLVLFRTKEVRRVFSVRANILNSSSFLNFNFYTFTAFSPNPIEIIKVLASNLFIFVEPFDWVYHLL